MPDFVPYDERFKKVYSQGTMNDMEISEAVLRDIGA